MKVVKTKAELLSEYVSKHMKDNICIDSEELNRNKPKTELCSDMNSIHHEILLKDQNCSQSKRMERSSSQIVNHIKVIKDNTDSVCSFIPSQKEETDIKEEFKSSQIEVNSVNENRSIKSASVKLEKNDAFTDPYFGGAKYGLNHQNHSQTNFNSKLDLDKVSNNAKTEHPYYMRPPININNQMMSQTYSNGYHMAMPYQPCQSQQIINYEFMNGNRPGNMTPIMFNYSEGMNNSSQMSRSLLNTIPSQPIMYNMHPQMGMRIIPRVPSLADFSRSSPPVNRYYHQVPNYLNDKRITTNNPQNIMQNSYHESRNSHIFKQNIPSFEQKKCIDNSNLSALMETSTKDTDNSVFDRYKMYQNPDNLGSEVELSKSIYPFLNSIGIDARDYISKSEVLHSQYNKYISKQEPRCCSGVYYPDDKPVLQNIVSTCNMCCKIDLSEIAMKAKNTEYNPRRFAAAIMKIKHPKTTALIFSSGKMVCTGAKSEDDSKFAAKKFAKKIQIIGYKVRFTEFKIQNIVGSCDLRFCIRLESLHIDHHKYASYDPEIFPGLIYRVMNPKVVILIFVSGKIVLTGAKTREDIIKAYNYIYPVLKKHRKLEENTDQAKEYQHDDTN